MVKEKLYFWWVTKNKFANVERLHLVKGTTEPNLKSLSANLWGLCHVRAFSHLYFDFAIYLHGVFCMHIYHWKYLLIEIYFRKR
jgi:hypothetical protein